MSITNLKRIIPLLLLGLLIGLLMPPVEYVAVLLADYGFACFTQIFHKDGFALDDPWLSIVFVLVEIITLFFLTRFNKILTAAALLTAIITTAYVIYAMSTLTPFTP